jgi:3-deoxy-manno-octulosonate cytidylyltransferase (CMP-KDO synthetase)
MMTMKVIGVIPARYASVRFPGKPLAMLAGKPLIQHVHERASRARTLGRLLIATDDERIRAAAESFGAEVVMTAPDAPSGSDRIVEAVGHLSSEIVVNIQGDEPFVDPAGIDDCVEALRESPDASVATLIERITTAEDLLDPNVVKVVNDDAHNALYFSRSIIPFPRGYETEDGETDIDLALKKLVFYKHIGLYAWRHDALMRFASLPPSFLEMTEKLEQLRLLQAGGRIRVIETTGRSLGVDTPEDLATAERLIAEGGVVLE